jgi:hypothetical protein
MVAKGIGVDLGAVALGFLNMWELCWAQKQPHVTLLELECLFGAPGERVGQVLECLGFLESANNGTWRVRGSEAYLRITETRIEAGRKGGKKTASSNSGAKNLRQNQSEATEAFASVSPSKSEATTEAPPKPLHHTPITNHPSFKNTAPEIPAPGWEKLVDRLFCGFAKIRNTQPIPRGKDWKALKRLRGRVKDDDEILRRWERGLASQFKSRVDSFWDLDERWDAITAADPPRDAPRHLGATGTDEDFEREMAHFEVDADGMLKL